jgi:hypothetical protein
MIKIHVSADVSANISMIYDTYSCRSKQPRTDFADFTRNIRKYFNNILSFVIRRSQRWLGSSAFYLYLFIDFFFFIIRRHGN